MAFIPGGTGTASSFPDGFTGSPLANVETISATKVLTTSDRRTQILTPSGALRIAQLPATAIIGEGWSFVCAAGSAFSLQVNASNGTTITTLAPGESTWLNASTATPTDAANWAIQIPSTVLSNGTVSTPALRFTGGGSDTGIYSPALDQIAISTAGVQRLLITDTGAITIGVGTAANLSIWTASNVLRQRGGTSGWALDNSTGTTMSATDAGAVTVGANTAHTFGNDSTNATTFLELRTGGTNNSTGVRLFPKGTGVAYFANNTVGAATEFYSSVSSAFDTLVGRYTSAGAWTLGPVSFNNNHLVRGWLRVTAGAEYTGAVTNVSNFTSKVTITSPTGSTNAKGFIGLEEHGGGGGAGLVFSRGGSFNTAIDFYTNTTAGSSTGSINTLAGSINDAGTWTLGPSAQTVEHQANGRFVATWANTGSTTTGALDGYRKSSTATHYISSLFSDVGGTAVLRWRVEADGDTISSTGSYTSDARAKKNLTPIQYGLSEVLQLTPKSFNWWYEDDNETPNFCASTAQEVEAIMPELVRDDGLDGPNGIQMKAVYEKELVPVLVKAIQELHAELQALKSQVNGE